MIAATSGGLGDIVYSIPVMKKLGIHTLYVKENYYYNPYGSLFTSCKTLLESQGFKVLPTSGAYHPMVFEPTLRFNYNMDLARRQPRRGSNHIIISYLNEFGLSHTDWTKPWLNIECEREILFSYSIIQRTQRWRRGSQVNWKKVVSEIKTIPIFVGFKNEYEDFCQETGTEITYYPTKDILEMAQLIKYSDAFYSNQSVGLTIAQGLGKEYFLDRNPGRTNTLMNTKNEHLL
jgi:hypothetical protein